MRRPEGRVALVTAGAFALIAALIVALALVACEGGFSGGELETAPSGAGATDPAADAGHDDAQPTPTTAPAPTPTATPGSASTPVGSADRDALVVLYNATDGPNWANNGDWLSDRPLREWFGVFPDRDGRVQYLDLSWNRLSGEIPAELGNLASLETLYLRENDLSGEIPPQLGNLSNLKVLSLNSNRLSGRLPPELGNLAALLKLDLWDNELSGEIPPELGNLASLWTLSLAENRLTGGIPAELGKLADLRYLDLENNDLSGGIPPELGNLEGLRVLWLSGNRLSGDVPPELANRRYLDLSGSDVVRCIPEGLRNVRSDSPPTEPRVEVVDRTSDTATLRIGALGPDGVAEEEPAHIQRADHLRRAPQGRRIRSVRDRPVQYPDQ